MKYTKSQLLEKVLFLEQRLDRLEQRFNAFIGPRPRKLAGGLGSRGYEIRAVPKDEPPEAECLPIDA